MARSVVTKSCPRTSSTAARVVRAMIPTGTIASVITGITKYRRSSGWNAEKLSDPLLPIPDAGNQASSTANTITITNPSQ